MSEVAAGLAQVAGALAVMGTVAMLVLALSGVALPDAEVVLVLAVGEALGWLGYAWARD